jgi:hypothetical protein
MFSKKNVSAYFPFSSTLLSQAVSELFSTFLFLPNLPLKFPQMGIFLQIRQQCQQGKARTQIMYFRIYRSDVQTSDFVQNGNNPIDLIESR